jgi:3-deoxy-manno-octulosonate cytidylyltransferase (CMP-KDO synthetase)
MVAIGVIPARWGSTRFPGKSLVEILGKPLIARVVENACRAEKLDEVIVATDDERIAAAVEGMNVRAVMTREDHPSGTDRIAEAVEGLEADIVVNVQGDEPLISPALIDELVTTLSCNSDWDMATAAAQITDADMLAMPQVVKVVRAADGGALYFSRSLIPHVRDGDASDDLSIYKRHVGIYAYRKEFLARMVAEPPCMLEKAEMLEQLRALYIGGRIAVLDAEETGIGVDTPEDVATVEAELKKRLKK